MKKLLIILIVLMLTQACYVNAQPQWKFYLAFEDGIGAKDTMWFIWDTTATIFIDTALGECTTSLNTNVFNVYTMIGMNPNDDSSKVFAIPYIHYFEVQLKAFNYIIPLKISWDTSLFHADYLPPEPVGWVNYARLYSDYFFWVNNNPNDQDFDMTLIDSVISPDPSITDPWFWQSWIHFPLSVYMHQEPSINIYTNDLDNQSKINAYPNPFKTSTQFTFYLKDESSVAITIYDQTGKKLSIINPGLLSPGNHSVQFNSGNLPSGIYFYSLEVNGIKTDTKKMTLIR